MGRVFRPYYTKDGKRVTVKSWYAEWHGADGKTHRKRVGARHEAEDYLARMQARERRARQGLDPDPAAHPDRRRPLADLLTEYVAVLAARGTSDGYRDLVTDYLARTFTGCGWFVWGDLTADSLLRFLGGRRDVEKNGPATLNGYLRIAKGFAKWLGKRLGLPSPVADVKDFPEAVDRRRSKRILTDAELAALVAAAAKGRRSGRQILSPRDRAMLYRVAAFTGIRAGELAGLTPAAFRLDAEPPVVTVAAADAKGKREEPIPLPSHLVALLRPWLAKKPRGKPVWPGAWARHRHQRDWIATDLKRAGVAEFDDQGRRVTFHSLKRRYVVRLIQAGAKIHEVRRLARHRDVATTLNYYTDTNLADLGHLADRLPGVG